MSSGLHQSPDTVTYSTQPKESSVSPLIVLDAKVMPASFPRVLSKANITKTESQSPNKENAIDKSRDTTVIVNADHQFFKQRLQTCTVPVVKANLGLSKLTQATPH